jgi:hypothetical protein
MPGPMGENRAKIQDDIPSLKAEYDKIVDHVRQTRFSGIRMDDRRFTAPVEEISGTVASSGPYGFERFLWAAFCRGASAPFSTLGGAMNAAFLAINRAFSSVYGGDDGARTRDLCRDRAAL